MTSVHTTRTLTYLVGDSAEPFDVQVSTTLKIYQLKAVILDQRRNGLLRHLELYVTQSMWHPNCD